MSSSCHDVTLFWKLLYFLFFHCAHDENYHRRWVVDGLVLIHKFFCKMFRYYISYLHSLFFILHGRHCTVSFQQQLIFITENIRLERENSHWLVANQRPEVTLV